ncbi:MAG: hypothetical protein M3Y87_13000 [Myxococcota bacterium]|nr:hypothetical protein [Myxococcota bacterium]
MHRGRALALGIVVVAIAGCVLFGGCADEPTATTDAGAPPARDAGPSDAGPPYDAGPLPPFTGEHTFPAVELAPGGERLSLCQSWTLNNDEDLWVHEVEMTAGAGWHHSNWMFVPETAFPGADGTWRCSEREFSEVAASIAGGSVFFAQSTQSTGERQTFPPGAAYRIPARSRIIGSIHVLNTSPEPIATSIGFRIGAIAEDEVTTALHPLAIDNRGIDLAPRSRTEVTTGCDLRRANGGALEFSAFYVLPHYHAIADGLRVQILGGPRDGEIVFETSGGIGNALGGPLEPPIDLRGADGLRVTCTYDNTGAERVAWGANAEDEMCTMLAYTDALVTFGGIASSIATTDTLGDGTVRQESSCLVIRN